jgi:hypothetical protein
MPATTRDKHGREFMVGDVIKVFHFVGARRKQYFMYKHVVGTELLGGLGGSPAVEHFEISHLNLDHKENYYLGKHEGRKNDCEILQGLVDIEDRPKHPS